VTNAFEITKCHTVLSWAEKKNLKSSSVRNETGDILFGFVLNSDIQIILNYDYVLTEAA
jgi:hypothetical protein